jgi:excisionase family DNA binding protein
VKPYNTREAAEILEVSQRTVIRLCDSGELPCYRTSEHGQRRIKVADLKAYLKCNR